eukprot:447633_1
MSILFAFICLKLCVSKRITPWWNYTFDTLGDMAWASGQGGSSPTGFPTQSVNMFSRYPIMWTQGTLTQSSNITGYENWENGTISDAKKIHIKNPKEPVMGYYGFPGCCYSHFAGYYNKWLNQSNLFLKDDTGKIVMWVKDGTPYTPMFDWCNPAMFTFFTQEIIYDFMQSDEISGVFFDECDSFVEGPQAFWYWGGYQFSQQSQDKLRECFENAMVNVTKYVAVEHNKWAIPSSNAYNQQFPEWSAAQSDVIINFGGFKFIEWLNCFGVGYVVNVTDKNEFEEIIIQERKRLLSISDLEMSNLTLDSSNWACPWFNDLSQCCQTQILTSMNISNNGGALLIRGGQNEDSDYADRYFQIAAFLFMANEYSYFAAGAGWSGVQSFPWFDIYNYPIGEPQQDTQIHNKQQTIFSRQFKNVYVSFNLTQGVSALYFNWNA